MWLVFALRAEMSCQNNADFFISKFYFSVFCIQVWSEPSWQILMSVFSSRRMPGTPGERYSWFQNDWNWPLLSLQKHMLEKNTTFLWQHLIEDEANVTGSCTLFIYIYFFTSSCRKQVKKDTTRGLAQDRLSRSQRDKQRFVPSQQDFRQQQSATFHSVDSLFEKHQMISTQYV